MTRSTWRAVVVIAVSFALRGMSAHAEQSSLALTPEPDALRNLKAASVEVVGAGEGLLRNQLETILATAMGDLGISPLPPGAYPSLRLNVMPKPAQVTNGSGFATSYVILSLNIELRQTVTIAETPPRRTIATTWSKQSLNWALESEFSRWTQSSVRSLVQEFAVALSESRKPSRSDGAAANAAARPGALREAKTERLAFRHLSDFTRQYRLLDSGARTTTDSDIQAVNGESSGPNLLICTYEATSYPTRLFWLRDEPFNAAKSRLSSRLKNHPLLEVGSPQENCPTTLDDAIAQANAAR